jgi:hypothetical protein
MVHHERYAATITKLADAQINDLEAKVVIKSAHFPCRKTDSLPPPSKVML